MKLSQIFIAEAQDYRQMFNDVLQYVEAEGFDPVDRESIRKYVDFIVNQAKTQLKRNDRIVWFLRLAKVCAWAMILRQQGQRPEQIAKHPFIQHFVKKTQVRSATITPELVVRLYGSSGDVHTLCSEMGHYLSLNIDKITNYVFGWQWVADVTADFHNYEQEWKARQKARIEHDPEAVEQEVVIDFGNGWYWINLNRASCRIEGDAMGHCGNTAASREGDTVLSLRELVVEDGKKFWVPHLTFILDKDGFLGETKGRNNNKPSAKYHDMIMALLKTDRVVGIKGGGYAAQNNFKLTDLTDEQQKELEGQLEQKQESTIASVYNNGLNADNGPDLAALLNCEYDEEANAIDTGEEINIHNKVFEIWPESHLSILQYLDYGDNGLDDELEQEDAFLTVLELMGFDSYGHFVSDTASMLDKLDPELYEKLSQYDDNLPLFDFNVFKPAVFIKLESRHPDDPIVQEVSLLIGKRMLEARLKDLIKHVEDSYTPGMNCYMHRKPDGEAHIYIDSYDIGQEMESYDSAEDAEEQFSPHGFLNYANSGYDTGFRGSIIEDPAYGMGKPESWEYVPDIVDEEQFTDLLKNAMKYFRSEQAYASYLDSLKPKPEPETTEN